MRALVLRVRHTQARSVHRRHACCPSCALHACTPCTQAWRMELLTGRVIEGRKSGKLTLLAVSLPRQSVRPTLFLH